MQSLWMVVGALAFAAMGASIKWASADYGIFEIIFWRGLVGMLPLMIYAYRLRQPMATPRLRQHGWRALLGGLSMLCWFYSLGVLPLGTATTLNYTSPLFIAIIVALTVWWRGGRQSARGWLYAAILAGFVGMMMMLRPSVNNGQELAMALGLLSGLLGAFAYLQVRTLGKLGEPEWRTVFWFSAANALIGVAGVAVTGRWQVPPLADLGLLISIGVFATFGQLCMTRAFSRGGTLLAANLQYTGVVFGAGAGWWLFGEHHDALELLGMALIVVSGVAATIVSVRSPAPETLVKSDADRPAVRARDASAAPHAR